MAGFIETEDRASSEEIVALAAMRLRSSEMVVAAQYSAARLAALTMTRGTVALDGMLAEYWEPALTRDFLFQACFDVLTQGNAVYYLVSVGNAESGSLRRVSEYEIKGADRPYVYRICVPTPDSDLELTVPGNQILHMRLGTNSMTPWDGRGVFSDTILPGIDMGFKMESRFPTQRFMPFPVDKMANVNINDQEKATRARGKAENETISRTSGVYNLPNTTNRGAQKIEISSARFAPDGNAVTLRGDLVGEVWESIGYPPALRAEAVPGQAARQLFSQWVDTFLQPVCNMLSDQLAAALECKVDWDLGPAKVPLVGDQATAFRMLTRDGKVSAEEAARAVGLSVSAAETVPTGGEE